MNSNITPILYRYNPSKYLFNDDSILIYKHIKDSASGIHTLKIYKNKLIHKYQMTISMSRYREYKIMHVHTYKFLTKSSYIKYLNGLHICKIKMELI